MQHCISVNCIPIDLTLALFDVCCEYVFLASVDNFAQLLTIIGEMWQCGVTFIIQCSALTVWHFFHFFFSVIFLISVRSGPDIFLSLSLLQAGLDPSGEGSATRVLRLHSALFSTSIRSTRKSSMLYFTTSIHLFLCLPHLCCPCTSVSKILLTQSSSSRHCTCPNHLNLDPTLLYARIRIVTSSGILSIWTTCKHVAVSSNSRA